MGNESAAGGLGALRQMNLRDIPMLRQLGLLIGLAAAIAAGLSLFFWSQKPDNVPLYAGLSDKDSAELAEVLRAAQIPFKLDAATGAVTVPAEQVHAARLQAASQGLPKGGSSGFEMIQGEQGFGVSQFIENARYQLALETELARTVSSLQPVKSARVHLALPKASAFTKNNASSASVVVELQQGRQLEANQVSAIEHIVASSVPGLQPTAVTVIDQFGRLLSSAEKNSEFAESTEQYQYARRAEADFVRRIESLLAPMVGVDHISAQVAADFDFSVVEEARESYKPEGVVRSEQINEDTRRDGKSSEAVGIPGATSNQPPAAAPAADPAAAPAQASAATALPTAATRSETRNFEIDRTVSHTRQSIGRLRRLSVAVLVDHVQRLDAEGKPVSVELSAQELAKVEALVKQAVGFDPARGDAVTVQNAPFVTTQFEAPPPLPIWQRGDVRDYARQGLGALVVLVLIFAVLRPMLRNILAGPARPEAPEPEVLTAEAARREALAGDGSDGLAADQLSLSSAQHGALAPPAYEQKLALARTVVAEDPKRVAQVVKTWLNEEGA